MSGMELSKEVVTSSKQLVGVFGKYPLQIGSIHKVAALFVLYVIIYT